MLFQICPFSYPYPPSPISPRDWNFTKNRTGALPWTVQLGRWVLLGSLLQLHSTPRNHSNGNWHGGRDHNASKHNLRFFFENEVELFSVKKKPCELRIVVCGANEHCFSRRFWLDSFSFLPVSASISWKRR